MGSFVIHQSKSNHSRVRGSVIATHWNKERVYSMIDWCRKNAGSMLSLRTAGSTSGRAMGHNSEFINTLRSEMRFGRLVMYSRHFANEGCCSSGSRFSLRLGSAYSAETWAIVCGIAGTAWTWRVGDDVMNDELEGAGASSQSRSSHGEDIAPAVDQYGGRPSSGWVVLEWVSLWLGFQNLPHIAWLLDELLSLGRLLSSSKLSPSSTLMTSVREDDWAELQVRAWLLDEL